jgi:hypothetical protein
MKSTKNLLIMSIALTVALGASVQITAMARVENRHLSVEDKAELKEALRYTDMYLDPKMGQQSPEKIKELRKQKEAIEKILYGNRDYSYQEIQASIYE